MLYNRPHQVHVRYITTRGMPTLVWPVLGCLESSIYLCTCMLFLFCDACSGASMSERQIIHAGGAWIIFLITALVHMQDC